MVLEAPAVGNTHKMLGPEPLGLPRRGQQGVVLEPPAIGNTRQRERGQVTNLAGTTAKGDEPDWGRGPLKASALHTPTGSLQNCQW